MLSPEIYNFFSTALKNSIGNHLEIGIFDGTGIRKLAMEFPNKKFYTIDPFIEDGNTTSVSHVSKFEVMGSIKDYALANIDLPNIKHFMMKSIDFKNSFSDDQLDELMITSISIDGSHWYDDVKADIDISKRILRNKNGIIHFHDCVMIPDVSKAYKEFIEETGFKTDMTGADSAVVYISRL